jgi:hypothetical protein
MLELGAIGRDTAHEEEEISMTTFLPTAGRSPSCHDVRFRAARVLLTVGSLLAVSLPTSAFAQTTACGQDVKEYVAAVITRLADADEASRLAGEKALYAQFSYCVQDAQLAPDSFHAAAKECGASVSQLGSIFYEEMSCAGYDPQRRQFAAPIKIKQTFGFGGAPLPGSREYVLHCVADPNGVLQPVADDSVHLANAIAGAGPTWQFAVIANANDKLGLVYPMNGATRRARSILSWAFKPTGCNFTPIWGNALNYRIRLDQ